jgi:hypothetical protein
MRGEVQVEAIRRKADDFNECTPRNMAMPKEMNISHTRKPSLVAMSNRAVRIAFLAVGLTVFPAAAADMNCAQWMAYRMGDTNMKAQGLVLITFVQGYIDAVNEFSDLFSGYLISEVSPGKFAPTAPTRPLTLDNTIAVLDRQCTENRAQSAHVAAVVELHSEMLRRATPIFNSMRTVLRNLNDCRPFAPPALPSLDAHTTLSDSRSGRYLPQR